MNPNNFWETATTTFTTITTVTDPAAVVWVDQNNNVIYTEFKTTATDAPAPGPTRVAAQDAPPAPPSPPPAPPSSRPEAAPAPQAPAPAPSNPAPANDQNVQPQNGGQGANAQSGSYGGGYGICYDLMASSGACRSPDQMNSELGFLKSQGFGLVRSYDIGCDVGGFVTAAGNNGLKVIVGINLINNVAGDIQKLIGKVNGNWGSVHTVNVGNEIVNNGGSADAVVAAINQARPMLQNAGYSGNVVAVDTFNQHVSFPAICGASDYCAANAHAFFDPQTSAPDAGQWVKNAHDQIQKIANGKKVVITESGWAKSGATEGASVPGVSQQQQAVSSLKQDFSGNQDELYLFQAYDATYKAAGARGVETSFGIFS